MERVKYGRCVCFALIIALCVTVSGCSNKPDANNKEAQNSNITLTYWMPMDENAASVVSDMSQVDMYKELEKKTGIKIKFMHPPSGQDQEQFNILLASKDLPDIIEYKWAMYPGGPVKAINDKIIVRIDDLVNKYAPNFKKILDNNKDLNKQARLDNGGLYGFQSLNLNQHIRVYGGPIIRKDWLDDLGLQAPETISDWENVLKSFKDKKGATCPLTFQYYNFTVLYAFIGAYGVINRDFYLDNGKVKYGPLEPGYKDFLTTFSKWYKEGLIDPDFATQDLKNMDSKILDGKSGAFIHFIGSGIGKYLGIKQDGKFDLQGVQYPVLNKGEQPTFIPRDWDVANDGCAAITVKNKHPVETAKWLDYAYGEEGHNLYTFGIKDKTYTMENGKPKYTDLILHNPDKLPVSQAMCKYLRANYPTPGYQDEGYLEQYYQYQQQKDAALTWSKYSSNALKVLMPPVTASQDEFSELSKTTNEVNTYVDEMIFKFIMGLEPLSNFDKFTSKLKSMGIEKAISIKQAEYDRYLKR